MQIGTNQSYHEQAQNIWASKYNRLRFGGRAERDLEVGRENKASLSIMWKYWTKFPFVILSNPKNLQFIFLKSIIQMIQGINMYNLHDVFIFYLHDYLSLLSNMVMFWNPKHIMDF